MLEVGLIAHEDEGYCVDFLDAEDLVADDREFGEGVQACY